MISDEAVVEAAARACHEANRAWQIAWGEPGGPWEETSEELRAGVRAGVRALRAGKSPRELHAAWMEYRQLHGWKFGPVKDESKREHPCLVPYDELPERDRQKDHVFSEVARAMLHAFEVVEDRA